MTEPLEGLDAEERRCGICGARMIRLRAGTVSGRFHEGGPAYVCPSCDVPPAEEPSGS